MNETFALALGLKQAPIQWALGALSSGLKRPEHEDDHSPHVVLRLRMRGAILPLHITYSWCGA
jgi:hypothetical protein